MIASIIDGLLGVIGTPIGAGIFVLTFIYVLAILFSLNYIEMWFLVIISIGILSSESGGGLLPEWLLVVILVPLGWLVGEIIMKRWQGQSQNI
jgi:hypothetical protein